MTVLGLPHHVGVLFPLARLPVAVLEVLLAITVWRGLRAGRVAQTILSALVVAAGLLSTFTGSSQGTRAGATGVVGVVGSAAVLVLLWLSPTRTWFRDRSVGPAGPGL